MKYLKIEVDYSLRDSILTFRQLGEIYYLVFDEVIMLSKIIRKLSIQTCCRFTFLLHEFRTDIICILIFNHQLIDENDSYYIKYRYRWTEIRADVSVIFYHKTLYNALSPTDERCNKDYDFTKVLH